MKSCVSLWSTDFSSAKVSFLKWQPVDFYTNISRTSFGSSRAGSAFPQEPFVRQLASGSRFLWSVGWFGRLHRRNPIRSPAIGMKYRHPSIDIFCSRKAITTLMVIARQDPSSHLFLLTYWGFFKIIIFSTLSEQ